MEDPDLVEENTEMVRNLQARPLPRALLRRSRLRHRGHPLGHSLAGRYDPLRQFLWSGTLPRRPTGVPPSARAPLLRLRT